MARNQYSASKLAKKHDYKDYPTSRPGIWEKYSPERAKQK